jgi:hypothetical protein
MPPIDAITTCLIMILNFSSPIMSVDNTPSFGLSSTPRGSQMALQLQLNTTSLLILKCRTVPTQDSTPSIPESPLIPFNPKSPIT